MDEFESFFSQLIPPPEQDLWLMTPQDFNPLTWSQPPSLNSSQNQLLGNIIGNQQQQQQQQQQQHQQQQQQQQQLQQQQQQQHDQQVDLLNSSLQKSFAMSPNANPQQQQQQQPGGTDMLSLNVPVKVEGQQGQSPQCIDELQRQHHQFVQFQQDYLLKQQQQLQQLSQSDQHLSTAIPSPQDLLSHLTPQQQQQHISSFVPSPINVMSPQPSLQHQQLQQQQQSQSQQQQPPQQQFRQQFQQHLQQHELQFQQQMQQQMQQQQQIHMQMQQMQQQRGGSGSGKTKKKGKKYEDDEDDDDSSNLFFNEFGCFDDDKNPGMRVNQNLASRNYRQRRKDYIKEIEAKLASLTFENLQLKRENETLKETGGVDVMRPEPELLAMLMEGKQIIIQMSQAIKKNDERTLVYLLHLFHTAIGKRYAIAEKEVEKIVHPYTQSKLASMGYVPKGDRPLFNISGSAADGWFALFKSEANISEEQNVKLEALRQDHDKQEQVLRIEREQLDKEIKNFYYTKILVLPDTSECCSNSEFNTPTMSGMAATVTLPQPAEPHIVNSSPLEISQILDFARKLDMLKKNFICSRNLSSDTISGLSNILTPRQEAMLLVRIHLNTTYDFAHMELLKDVWTNIANQNKSTAPKNIAEALAKFSASEAANVMPTVEQIVKPPQFHQYNPNQVKKERASNSDKKKKAAAAGGGSAGRSSAKSKATNNTSSSNTIIINTSNNITNNSNTNSGCGSLGKETSSKSPPDPVFQPPPPEAIPYTSSNSKQYQWYVYPSPQ
ncbi:hypothetical protein SAMD00019534_063920 [Acytostelium subglobosum LB1]|uniref:hypothetical protein n=1 Tax=Acytostelium subglobosum LB1 TaxID=1410327 RepID=UPI000644B0C4|nr:hypothetical protein SAMD00019534_063920 [Acytostelium subglobosum LB1]GAM23217.1 hypothetical protein SAMD00019534_063920 [Acytostelium subglobosum LB1]|eukprot:XP_012753666.1 hypothetical protein SAMD00019534_063920 [Acytostelium subglobosum LB1]